MPVIRLKLTNVMKPLSGKDEQLSQSVSCRYMHSLIISSPSSNTYPMYVACSPNGIAPVHMETEYINESNALYRMNPGSHESIDGRPIDASNYWVRGSVGDSFTVIFSAISEEDDE